MAGVCAVWNRETIAGESRRKHVANELIYSNILWSNLFHLFFCEHARCAHTHSFACSRTQPTKFIYCIFLFFFHFSFVVFLRSRLVSFYISMKFFFFCASYYYCFLSLTSNYTLSKWDVYFYLHVSMPHINCIESVLPIPWSMAAERERARVFAHNVRSTSRSQLFHFKWLRHIVVARMR